MDHREEKKECQTGWWDPFIGPGKALDTNKYFIICANYLGGCYGSTGPSAENPETGKPYGSDFPQVSITDIVKSQIELINDLGIEELHGRFLRGGRFYPKLYLRSKGPRYIDLRP